MAKEGKGKEGTRKRREGKERKGGKGQEMLAASAWPKEAALATAGVRAVKGTCGMVTATGNKGMMDEFDADARFTCFNREARGSEYIQMQASKESFNEVKTSEYGVVCPFF